MKNYKEELKKLSDSILVELARIINQASIEEGLTRYKRVKLKGNIKYLGGKITSIALTLNVPDSKYTEGGYRLYISNNSSVRLVDTDIYILVAITEELKQLSEESKKIASIYANV